MVLSLLSNFTTTIREALLLSFDVSTKELYFLTTEEELDSPKLNFYILDGQHTICAQKKIIENDKFKAVHSRYGYQKARLLHKDVPQHIITKLCKQQNLSNKEFSETSYIYQVIKAR